ncbi:MAG: NADH-quinone oxidoreductase subunit N [Longispora sp.]|nr:NADH-quinone oxidoreductase subunit N [Longispora sp. (in: high G+C Gram-positive bacteria)]
MIQSIDHVALLPAYVAAAAALVIFLADLLAPRRAVSLACGAIGALAVIPAAWAARDRATLCSGESGTDCSYIMDKTALLTAILFAILTAAVFLLSAYVTAEPGEYAFLLACSMAGGVVLGAARDLITLIVALETLTLPLYALVALRRGRKSGEGAVTFFVVSVVSTAVTLLGAALLYASIGAVHLAKLRELRPEGPLADITTVGIVLILVGLGFKVAAVPLHGWAPATYDGAPLPVAGYLSTASKLGGVVALVLIAGALRGYAATAGALAALAVLTMTVGNIGALRQTRMVRLLAWSSIAQAGYVLAALVVSPGAAVAYTIFFVLTELLAFAAVITARRDDPEGGLVSDYRGLARRAPWVAGALVLALAGLAGLPPGLAGMFGKIVVIKALVDAHWTWLAVLVALNAVVALAYYVRVGASMFAQAEESFSEEGVVSHPRRVRWPVAIGLAALTAVTIVAGFTPQWVLNAAGY